MSGTPRPSVLAGTWVVSFALMMLAVVLGSVAPESLDGQEAPGPTELGVGLVAITAQVAVLALVPRRLSASVGLLLVCAVAPLAAAAGLGAATGVTSVAVLVATYSAVVRTAWLRAVPVLAAATLLVALAEVVRAARAEGLSTGSVGAAVLQGAVAVAVGAVVGTVVAARRELTAARADQVRAAASEREALAEAAVARQRTAMARELHDIAAHHLSGIAVMTAALDRQIDTDPVGAKVAVRQVRTQSTAMLKDLRNLVVLLREDDADTVALTVAPETLDGVVGLVEQASSVGREVRLSVLGTAVERLASVDVGPLAQLAAFRTVREALANASRHAPGAGCEVIVDARDPEELVVTVRNAAPVRGQSRSSAREGFGILGMRERAELTDSSLSVGATEGGGFAVVLAIPRSGEDVS